MSDDNPAGAWVAINNLVAQENQYRDIKNPPLSSVRMAWPFKTEEELKILSKWYKKQQKAVKEKETREHVEKYGKALI